MSHSSSTLGGVDFRRSLPPVPAGLSGYWKRAIDEIAATHDLAELTHQSIARGSEADRIAGAQFLQSRFGEPLSPERVVVTNGTQSAILILMRRIVGSRGALVAERLSYGPLRLLADVAGIRVQALDIDEDGIIPDAFEAACRSRDVKALYCNPTVQNPTTAIMPVARRIEIADIARRHGVAIIEDDALGPLHLDAAKPIAALAPDVTWYVMTTTKCLTHGLRLAYLVTPSEQAASVVLDSINHLSYWHPAPLMSAIATRWVQSAVAEKIRQSISAECGARERAARELLAPYDIHSKPGSMHVWLKLPSRWSDEEFMHVADRRGVQVRAASLFAVGDTAAPAAARLSLSTPKTLAEVRLGLEMIRKILEERGG